MEQDECCDDTAIVKLKTVFFHMRLSRPEAKRAAKYCTSLK